MSEQPTMGRIVRYHEFTRTRDGSPALKAYPAIVTEGVQPDDSTKRVRLYVFKEGRVGPRFENAPYSEQPLAGHWSWPPSGQR
jgi:hypothetical protein